MPLTLVIHDLDRPGTREDLMQAFQDCLWQVSSTHWQMAPGSMLVSTSVSPAYLKDMIERAVRRAGGETGCLLVTPVAPDAIWAGLSAEGEAWMRDAAD